MRKLSFFASILLIATCWSLPAYASVPAAEEIAAEAVVLMDAETGQVLYEKDPHSRRHPASITKIMTALLVLEHLESTDAITASESAVNLPSWSSSAYLKESEQLTVEQTMYAMMLRSGNDAANVLAEAVARSVGKFAEMMNERAKDLGAVNTSFSNPHGLPRRNHLTTAYDMALITRAAIKTPGFLTYFGADSYPMPATNKNDARVFVNTHRMLLSNYTQYDETVIGGKTGYTTPSGYTLVTVAERNGRTLICVVLNSETFYADTKTLLDFGFNEFSPLTYMLQDSDAPPSVSVWDGNWEAGRAYLSAPKSASLLMHYSVAKEDIFIDYRYPEHPGIDDEIDARLEIHLTDGGVMGFPDTLLSIPLQVETVYYDPPVVETLAISTPADQEPQMKNRYPLSLLIAMLTGVIVLIIAATAIRKKQCARRRYRRCRKERRYEY